MHKTDNLGEINRVQIRCGIKAGSRNLYHVMVCGWWHMRIILVAVNSFFSFDIILAAVKSVEEATVADSVVHHIV
jgi:hypothetical protein